MSQIILYSEINCSGVKDTHLTDDSDYGIIDEVKSLDVTAGIWITFSEADFKGEIAVYEKGTYNVDAETKSIRSFRKLPKPLEDHFIEIYENPNFEGKKSMLSTENHNVSYSIMSYRVVDGVWLLYDDKDYKGKRIVSITGDQVKNVTDLGLGGPVKSLKPYLTYESPI